MHNWSWASFIWGFFVCVICVSQFFVFETLDFFLFYLILNFRKMDYSEMLAKTEGHVSVKLLERSDRKAHNLTNLLSEEDFLSSGIMTESWGNSLKIWYRSIERRIMRASKLNPGEISCAVGLLGNQRKGRFLDDWSLMEGDKLVVGVARWANHLCRPNCNYYMAGGFNGGVCVRLRY